MKNMKFSILFISLSFYNFLSCSEKASKEIHHKQNPLNLSIETSGFLYFSNEEPTTPIKPVNHKKSPFFHVDMAGECDPETASKVYNEDQEEQMRHNVAMRAYTKNMSESIVRRMDKMKITDK